MGLAVDIVKRQGRKQSREKFQRQKLYYSILAVCLSVKTPEGEAESIANYVCREVDEWLADKSEITSQDLRTISSKHLRKHHPEAAYLYEQYHITI
jgi:transcriptional regulator NrdR family protein